MEHLLTTLARLMEEHDLPALLIGGHAVIALGHPRATFDIDLLIPRSAGDAWKDQLDRHQYQVFSENRNFIQFESTPSLPLPALDLMLVDEDVFETLHTSRTQNQPIPSPAPQAMVALKLHAINQPDREDTAKDWSDILAIIDAQGLTLDDSEFSASVLKHGGDKAIAKITDHFAR